MAQGLWVRNIEGRRHPVVELPTKVWRYGRWIVLDWLKPSVVLDGVVLQPGRVVSRPIRDKMRAGRYEWQELSALKSALSPDDRVVEIGAGIGFLSTWCALRIGSQRVAAYEANPTLVDTVRKTFGVNGVAPHFESCLVGVDDNPAVPFYVGKHFWSGSVVASGEPITPVFVRQRGISSIVRERNPSLVILDVEGGEVDLLPALLDASDSSLRKIVMEVHSGVVGDDAIAVLGGQLRAEGFRVTELAGTWLAVRDVG